MKKSYLWIIAAIITVAAAVYQRTTGPTYPLKGDKVIHGQKISFKLKRSAETGKNAIIEAPVIKGVQAFVAYKRYKTNDSLTYLPMSLNKEGLFEANLPSLPAAGKFVYNVHYQSENDKNYWEILSDKDIVIRFKGEVPAWVLILHILFIFSAMLFSNFAGFASVWQPQITLKWSKITLLLLVIGGFILGPIVQKYAFGAFWTGFPFGYDLTDNKVLLSVLMWVISFLIYRKNKNPKWFLLAAVTTFLIYLIPHSMFGSELDFNTGVIKQG